MPDSYLAQGLEAVLRVQGNVIQEAVRALSDDVLDAPPVVRPNKAFECATVPDTPYDNELLGASELLQAVLHAGKETFHHVVAHFP